MVVIISWSKSCKQLYWELWERNDPLNRWQQRSAASWPIMVGALHPGQLSDQSGGGWTWDGHGEAAWLPGSWDRRSCQLLLALAESASWEAGSRPEPAVQGVSGSKHQCKVTPSLLDPERPVASCRLAHGCSGQVGWLKETSAALSTPWGHTERGARGRCSINVCGVNGGMGNQQWPDWVHPYRTQLRAEVPEVGARGREPWIRAGRLMLQKS